MTEVERDIRIHATSDSAFNRAYASPEILRVFVLTLNYIAAIICNVRTSYRLKIR